jgi:copper resistance protein B
MKLSQIRPLILVAVLAAAPISTLEVHADEIVQPNLSTNSDWPSPVSDSETYGLFLLDLLEYSPKKDRDTTSGILEWDLLAWRGGDYNRFWLKSEGGQSDVLSRGGNGDLRLLYGRMIWPFFDFQTGLRYAQAWGSEQASRFYGVLSLQGLAPYSYEIEPELFISQKGQVSFHFTTEQDFLMTQRAILQFRLETSLATSSDEALGVGSGFNDLSLGLRLRYELKREFAPYVGISWNALFGETDRLASQAASRSNPFTAMIGIRAWY